MQYQFAFHQKTQANLRVVKKKIKTKFLRFFIHELLHSNLLPKAFDKFLNLDDEYLEIVRTPQIFLILETILLQ
jgi:thiaminase